MFELLLLSPPLPRLLHGALKPHYDVGLLPLPLSLLLPPLLLLLLLLLLQDALKQYPQWSEAFKLAEQTGWPVSREQSDVTMFVPSE
jgi:hypothetical protein